MNDEPDAIGDVRARIDALKSAQAPKSSSISGDGAGFRIATDLVAGALVGCGLGWFIDQHAGTSPWFTLICFALGMIAAFRNIYRIMMRSGQRGETLPTAAKEIVDSEKRIS